MLHGFYKWRSQIILTSVVLIDVLAAASKLSKILQRLATLTGLSQRCVLDMVMRRERLGSTGIGGGIAIPHAVHDDLACTVALFAVLETPVDFDAIDGQPVDIICL